nr:HtaA domain-containing protein [Microbacterium pseudoresistens]
MPNQIVEGAFTTTLTVPAGVLDPEVAYHVATSAAHGLSVTDRSLDTFTPITVAQPAGPVEPGIRLSADAVAQGGSVTVSGSGLPAGTQVSVELHSDAVLLGSGLVGADGTFSVQGTIPASTPPGAHTIVVTGGGLNLSTPITITAAPVPAPAPAPEPAPEVCVANAVSGASLSWGVKESFVNYINGPIAKGSVSGSWGSGSGAYSTETGNGSVSFGGSMHFTGHSGALDLTLSNPRVRVNGSSATLYLSVQSKGYNGSPDINASGVAFATISLPSASTGGGEIGWSGASAALTAAGADAFAGFYGAGEALDAVSIAFPLGAEVPCDDSTGGLAVTGGEPAAGAAALGLGVLALGVVLVLMRRRRVAV